ATCDDAIALELTDGTYSFTTVGAADEHQPSCQSNDSSELVFRLEVTEPINVAFETSGFDTVLYLRSSCTGADLYCNDDGGSDFGSRIEAALTAGSYFLFVDGFNNAAATFTLTVDVEGSGSCGEGETPCGLDCCGADETCVDGVCVGGTVGSCTLPSSYGVVDVAGAIEGSPDSAMAVQAALPSADGTYDLIAFELYAGFGALAQGIAPGSYTLQGDDLNYATCGLCLRLFGDIDTSSGTFTQQFFATGGGVVIDQVEGTFIATVIDATFVEVTIDSTSWQSTPVPGGCTTEFESIAFNRPASGAEDCATPGDEDGDGLADCADPDCASAPECLSGATCDDAIALELTDGTYSFTTVGAADEHQPSCQSNDSSELVFRFEVTEPINVAFETSGFDTVLYLRSSCTGADLYCDDDSGSTFRGSRIEAALTAGTYFLFVDGFNNVASNFTLTVDVEAVGSCGEGETPCGLDCCGAGETCADGVCVGGTVGSCTLPSSYGVVDVAGAIEGSPDSAMAVQAALPSADGTYDLIAFELYAGFGALAQGIAPGSYTLQGDDLNYATCGLCLRLFGDIDTSSGTFTQQFFATGGGVVIDQVEGTFIATVIDATFVEVTIDSTSWQSTPVPGGCTTEFESIAFNRPASGAEDCATPGDEDGDGLADCADPDCASAPECLSGATCDDAIALELTDGTYSFTTVGAADEHQPSCQSNDSSELVFRLEVTEPINVAFETSGFDTVLYLRSSCTGADLYCNDDGGSDYGSRINALLAEGSYYLFVDGYDNAAAAFTLTVNVSQVSPREGEGCSDAILLSGEGSVADRTDDAWDDGGGSCGGTNSGPDRVYTFVAQARTRYQFTMTGYDTVLRLRQGTCTSASAEIACNDDIDFYNRGSEISGFVDPGVYYLFADSYDLGGSYTLEYSLRTDPCADDSCPGISECAANADWTGYECVCPAGTVPYEEGCVDDPCLPNPCANTGIEHRTTCAAELPNGYECLCDAGYVDDGMGGCMTDPNSNVWTFMVFMNGDNNLDSAGFDDIAEMQVAGSNQYVNIIVLQDSSGYGDTRMLRITRGGYEVLSHGLGAEVDMGRWQSLRDFGLWVIENYPSQHYALIVWNHGDGWRASAKSPLLRGFSNDDTNSAEGISISNGDYARALSAITQAAGRKLDLVGFDACLMGMYEVAKATAPYADYLVASSEVEPGSGWPYDAFLPGLTANYDMSAETLGRSIVDSYYAESWNNSTLALTDLSTIPELDAAISGFAAQLMANASLYSSVSNARSATQSFSDYENRDLADFAGRIAAMTGAPTALVQAAEAVAAQVEASVVHSRAQSSHPGSNGLAIYLPGRNAGTDPAYDDAGATWSVATQWDEFLRSFAQ
ncbi:MAG: clostripain-related cysteine peptidase, partial [Myxococcales bacterium]